MKNEYYYDALADKIVFSGLRSEEVEQFAKYRDGKSWVDLVAAVEQAKRCTVGCHAETFFEDLAMKISEVIEIDTSETLLGYERRLKRAVK